MIRRSVFKKIFQRGQRPVAKLYFIKDDQCLLRHDRFLTENAQLRDDPLRIQVPLKPLGQRQIALKVELGCILIKRLAKRFQQVGLSALPYSLDNERLSVWAFLPPSHIIDQYTLHEDTSALFV